MSENKKCGKPATKVLLWATLQEVDCCEDHAAWGEKVANAMGAPCRLTPIDPDDGRTCQQNVKDGE